MVGCILAFGVFALSLAALMTQNILLVNAAGALTVAQRLWVMAG